MSLRRIIYIITLGAILICVPFAYAYKMGEIEFNIHGRASESYDTNVTSANTNVKSDYITNLSAGIDANYEGRSSFFNLTGNVNQDIFAFNPRFTNTSEDFTLSYGQELSKLDRLSLSNVFTHTYDQSNFEDALGRQGGIYSYVRNQFTIGYTRDIMKQLSASLSYNNQFDLFSRSDMSDSLYNRASAELDYYLTSETIFFGLYNFSIRNFDGGGDATIHRLGGGIRQYATTQLYVDASGGADFINSYTNAGYVRPFVLASVTDDIDALTTARLSFRKEYYTIPYSEDLFNYWEISGMASRQFLERLSASLTVFYGSGEYVAQGRDENLFGIRSGFSYDLTKKIQLIGAYNLYMNDSNFDNDTYNRNKFTLGVSGKF